MKDIKIKRVKAFRSYKVEAARFKKLLRKCYIVLKHNVGIDEDDFLAGEKEKLDFLRKGGEEELKREVRKALKK